MNATEADSTQRVDHQGEVSPREHLRRAGQLLVSSVRRAYRELHRGVKSAGTEVRGAADSARARLRP